MEKGEQVMEPGATVTAFDVRERVRSEEKGDEGRGWERGNVKAVKGKKGGDRMKVGTGERPKCGQY